MEERSERLAFEVGSSAVTGGSLEGGRGRGDLVLGVGNVVGTVDDELGCGVGGGGGSRGRSRGRRLCFRCRRAEEVVLGERDGREGALNGGAHRVEVLGYGLVVEEKVAVGLSLRLSSKRGSGYRDLIMIRS